MSLPISTLVCGIESMDNLQQDLEIARNLAPMAEEEMNALRTQVKDQATDGRNEWFKSTQYYDGATHRDQHGFPPIGTVGPR
jgi:hypothetical protein